MNFTLTNFSNAAAAIGRGVVFQAPYWNGVADIALTHLGEVEGVITLNPNETVNKRTTPELSAEAARAAYVQGGAPTVSIPMYIGLPAVRAILSPTGSASMGHTRRRPVTYRTLAIFPEELMFDPAFSNPDGSLGAYKVLSYTTADGWEVNGEPLTAEQARLLGHSIWLWKGWFTRASIAYGQGDADKALTEATFECAIDDTKPDGHQLFTVGNPVTAGVLIDVA